MYLFRTACVVTLFLASCADANEQNVEPQVTLIEAATPASVTVEVMSTTEQWASGLMNRDGLEEGAGMFFIYPEERYLIFWMKNMEFSIDIIFIDKNFVIKKIWHSVPPCSSEPCEIYPSVEKVRYTLEVAAGFAKLNGVIETQRVQYLP